MASYTEQFCAIYLTVQAFEHMLELAQVNNYLACNYFILTMHH